MEKEKQILNTALVFAAVKNGIPEVILFDNGKDYRINIEN